MVILPLDGSSAGVSGGFGPQKLECYPRNGISAEEDNQLKITVARGTFPSTGYFSTSTRIFATNQLDNMLSLGAQSPRTGPLFSYICLWQRSEEASSFRARKTADLVRAIVSP